MTDLSVVFPDGSWIPISLTATTQTRAPTNQLHPHRVVFGTNPLEQFAVTLTPGLLQQPPAPVTPPAIDQQPPTNTTLEQRRLQTLVFAYERAQWLRLPLRRRIAIKLRRPR